MKLKKVYLFASVFSQYGVLGQFTHELSNALNRQGVISRVLETKKDDPGSFVDQIMNDPPDCTLSFNGLLPDEKGHFLCDLLKIPHLAYLVDAPHHFFPLVRSPRNIIACIDRHFCNVFKDFKFSSVLFLPHGVSKHQEPPFIPESVYDALMPVSFIDYEAIYQAWPSKYSPALIKVLEEAAELTLQSQSIDYIQAFVKTLDKHLREGAAIDPRQIHYELILDDLESYLVGKSRVELLQSIQDVTVHIVGSEQGEGWKKYLGEQSNIHIHPAVPYTEMLEMMKKSKIVLNLTPKIKHGGHERIFNAMAAKAAVLTLDTPFMQEHFKDESDVLLFKPRDWENVNKKLHAYLKDDNKRYEIAHNGYEKVMRKHTWDNRAAQLIQELPAILEDIQSSTQEQSLN